MNEEITKAQAALTRMKIREQEKKLIPIKVARNMTIMMSPNATVNEIQSKIKQYKK